MAEVPTTSLKRKEIGMVHEKSDGALYSEYGKAVHMGKAPGFYRP